MSRRFVLRDDYYRMSLCVISMFLSYMNIHQSLIKHFFLDHFRSMGIQCSILSIHRPLFSHGGSWYKSFPNTFIQIKSIHLDTFFHFCYLYYLGDSFYWLSSTLPEIDPDTTYVVCISVSLGFPYMVSVFPCFPHMVYICPYFLIW